MNHQIKEWTSITCPRAVRDSNPNITIGWKWKHEVDQYVCQLAPLMTMHMIPNSIQLLDKSKTIAK